MAVKKNTTTPEVAETAEEAKVTEKVTPKAEAEKAVTENKECQHFVYIGPTLPGGKLKSNTVLCGGIETIKEYYKDVVEQYPQVIRLIVPVQKLAELKQKAQTPGNIINKYFNDVVSAMSNKKEE